MKGIDSIPRLSLTLDGAPVPESLAFVLASVRIQQRLGAPTHAELDFVDPPSRGGLEVGQDLTVRIEGLEPVLFGGQITAIEHTFESDRGRRLIVRAYDALHILRKRQPAIRRVGVRAIDLARELTNELALKIEAVDPGPMLDDVVQHCVDDLQLLCDVCARAGLYPTLRGDTLHLVTLEGVGEPIRLDLGDELVEARFERNAEHACQSVAATCWSPKTAESFSSEVYAARSGREVEARGDAVFWTVDGGRVLTGRLAGNGPEAEALAQAELDRCAADEVRLTGIALGRPDLRSASIVDVRGADDDLCGRYVLTGVNHLIDGERGYVCELDTSAPRGTGAAWRGAPAAAVALGIVTRVDDPDALARVRVAFESHGHVESDWLAVVVPGAGPGRGLVALPEVGDEVLVLLPDGDPAKGIVLGGLFGRRTPDDPGISDGSVRRFTWSSGGGDRIRLDDEEEAVVVENRHENRLSLLPDMARIENNRSGHLTFGDERVELKATQDLVIAAPGRTITIRADQVRFERA